MAYTIFCKQKALEMLTNAFLIELLALEDATPLVQCRDNLRLILIIYFPRSFSWSTSVSLTFHLNCHTEHIR